MDPRFLPYLAQQTAETQAPAAPAQQQSSPMDIWAQYSMPLMILGVFAVMYFFSIRPARKEEKRKKEMLDALKKGDTVITSAGIIGSVHAVKEDTVILNVGDNTRMELLRSAIQEVRGRSSTEKAEKKEGK
ncbi:preprotein translocase subunit YajC [Leptonema illini]|jgi:preprotein translocase subunit YajC|uniref:Sec translocon accessory complex subunit YajC n=2 Tax=Leptonema illini TaxID=183 RepID=H2CB18_9LEPT|nr:preprotein translocase subunit YajC [Leptonema illini]EHQ08613.1 preprotein translocase, YajC subunit [Leptonema illini DSM 21528]